jgi:hypothetical protein
VKKTDQFELPFDGREIGKGTNTSDSVHALGGFQTPIVQLSQKRLERHVGVVYGRLLTNGFGPVQKTKR